SPQLDALIAQTGIRYVVVDRPGFGRSEPSPGRTVAAFAADVEDLADALGVHAHTATPAMVEDYLVCRRPWGFDPADVSAPVMLWHGAADPLVPAAHALRLAAAMPACAPSLERGAGHFFYSRRLARIIAP